ncbi:unnamed protein product [Didymodactylos carnosus]|uniref:Uncharacterized protein n=1 Tax=Didymodactylos carnosus TaxID=1234261 RepID=A0A814RT23_9BILA|nr:unnamed protein product [Didymodactylos carnosus]CAF1136125.1 unnamed protein product [Didymodactylos carnosus]CAF3827342.1 unnamed protein product [Didymodactylos carnosus]CAF3899811.1 unnamed protein product [Didymodactylos carnosus]
MTKVSFTIGKDFDPTSIQHFYNIGSARSASNPPGRANSSLLVINNYLNLKPERQRTLRSLRYTPTPVHQDLSAGKHSTSGKQRSNHSDNDADRENSLFNHETVAARRQRNERSMDNVLAFINLNEIIGKTESKIKIIKSFNDLQDISASSSLSKSVLGDSQ